jgi:hypothetical protein
MQFCDVFTFHLSPYQFWVVVKRGCEVMVHGIRITLYAHFDWVVLQVDIANASNTCLCKVIFQELWATWGSCPSFLHLFVLFMAFKFLCILVIILPQRFCQSFFVFGHMVRQPSNKASLYLYSFSCFALSLRVFLSCFFLSLTNDTHILALAHIFALAFDHFAS